MKKYSFGCYQLEIDMDATMKWYAQSKGWGCECGHCRNFLELAGKKELPVHIVEILDALGISPEKATYVGELYTDDAGVHYQFSYRIAGTFLEVPGKAGTEHQAEWRCCHEPYPYGAPDFPEPHFDLECYAALPWVLDEAKGWKGTGEYHARHHDSSNHNHAVNHAVSVTASKFSINLHSARCSLCYQSQISLV